MFIYDLKCIFWEDWIGVLRQSYGFFFPWHIKKKPILLMNMPTCTFHEICILTTEVLHQFDIDSYNILPWNDQGFSWNHLPSNFGRFPTEEKRLTSEQYMDHVRTKGERGWLFWGELDPNLVGNFLEPTQHMKPLYAECMLQLCCIYKNIYKLCNENLFNMKCGIDHQSKE